MYLPACVTAAQVTVTWRLEVGVVQVAETLVGDPGWVAWASAELPATSGVTQFEA